MTENRRQRTEKKKKIFNKTLRHLSSTICLLSSAFCLLSSALCLPALAGALEERTSATVKRVIDGDTFIVSTGEKIRLIGVDTPEYRPWENRVDAFGKEASEFSKKLLTGRTVYLESDAEKTDRYGRMLAYVYLEDGTFVNALLVREGLARAKRYPPNTARADSLKEEEMNARDLKKGLWGRSHAVPG